MDKRQLASTIWNSADQMRSKPKIEGNEYKRTNKRLNRIRKVRIST